MNTLISAMAVIIIIGVSLIFYIVIDTLYTITTDENPFNLREEDVDLFDKEGR